MKYVSKKGVFFCTKVCEMWLPAWNNKMEQNRVDKE